MNNSEVPVKKKSIIKYILLGIDALVIIGLVFMYFNKYLNGKEITDTSEYQFKEFKYNFPQNISFTVDNHDNMVLTTDEWTASIDILGDSDNYILTHIESMIDDYGERFKNLSTDYITISTSTLAIIRYTKENKNGMIGYFKTFREPFIYEVVLHNVDNSFDTEPYKEIYSYLMDGIYVETPNVDYNYVKIFQLKIIQVYIAIKNV